MKQNWSRRELEAFGETLGDSVTQRKLGGGYICGGGGKGGGGGSAPPAQQTVTQTSIPEYARPYVETMLGKSEALTDINQNPYQAYGGQRIAGFNPVQERAFADVQNRQTASQIGAGTALTGTAGLGAIGAGADYRNMATNPNATAAYMSPYMQNVVDTQKNEAYRDAQMRNIGANLGAARQGTYGGARQLLGEQERNRNLQQQLGNIQATGSQNAFQAAQQAQQFGTTAGLQGYNQAAQAGATLGQLGQTQFGQQQAINAAQQQVGAIQQAQAQQGLDLAYQDFLKQRNYPYQQLAFMSDMTRGIPLSQSAQQIYTAPPSAVSQLGGLGMSALGIYGMSGGFKPGAKEGGLMTAKAYKEGGLVYATGGDIKMMSTDQLEALLEKPGLTPLEVGMIEEQLILRRRMEMNPETSQIMAPALRSGIASIATGDMVPENMAGGGIVAFKAGGNSGVDNLKDKAAKFTEDDENYNRFLQSEIVSTLNRLKTEDPFKESRAQEADIRSQMAESKRMAPYAALTMAGLRTMQGTSQDPLSNLGAGGEEGFKSYARSKAEEKDLGKLLLQQGGEREKSKFARELGLLGSLQTSQGQIISKKIGAQNAAALREGANATRAGTLYNQLSGQYMTAVSREIETLRKLYRDQFNLEKTETELESEATANVMKRLPPQARTTLFGNQVIPEGNTGPAAAPASGSIPSVPSGKAAAPASGAPTVVKNQGTGILGRYEKLPQPKTSEDYKTVKSGQKYIHPDGSIRVKP